MNGTKNAEGSAELPTNDFDAAWKEALYLWLPDCLKLFWPDIHDQISWSVKPLFLKTELNNLQKSIQPNPSFVDQLAQVHLKQGHRALLLIHIEVQTCSAGRTLALRMLRYHNRLFERHPKHTHFPCAILLDRKRGPDSEEIRIPVLGGDHTFKFPVVNLAAWGSRQDELHAIAPTNPFAVVVLAQLTSRATRPDRRRLVSKLELAKLLKYWGYNADQRFNLMQIIDALLTLPEPLEEAFCQEALHIEDEQNMERLNSFQRVRLRRERREAEEIGIQKGTHTGIAGVLHAMLQQKFGDIPDWVNQRLQQADTVVLQQWALRFVKAESLQDVFDDLP